MDKVTEQADKGCFFK